MIQTFGDEGQPPPEDVAVFARALEASCHP